MRTSTSTLQSVLLGSFTARLLVDVYKGTDRVLTGLAVTQWQFDCVLDAQIKTSGALSIIYDSVNGESLVPRGISGELSPFGSRLHLIVEISADRFTERIPLGWVVVTSIPSGEDFWHDRADGSRVIYSSVVDVEFASLDQRIADWGFRFPQQPRSLASIYQEVRRITHMPVDETGATDTSLSTSITYDAGDGGRLAGVQALFKILDGVGMVDESGAWVCVPNVWGSVVGTLTLGASGTITELPYNMDTQGVYNCVVGNFQDPVSGASITSTAFIDGDGPLGVYGDWGEHTVYITDDNVTTKGQGATRVADELAKITSSMKYQIDVKCVFNPLVELGDIFQITGYTTPITGRVVKYSLTQDATMIVTLEVKRVLS